ncbi:AP2-like ethylene-responsive transcription factor AIL1 [Tanacetum coccineum]|uniref:AP2-like ethylene-responsive transcription factor AIL1 n=1 Tax=Tanacetum coccineum TaxID=301880 RepID=A0ABQ5GNI9_9ASTR
MAWTCQNGGDSGDSHKLEDFLGGGGCYPTASQEQEFGGSGVTCVTLPLPPAQPKRAVVEIKFSTKSGKGDKDVVKRLTVLVKELLNIAVSQGIGGPEDMKLTYGIIVAAKKVKQEKDAKALYDRYAGLEILLIYISDLFDISWGYDKEEKAARAYDLAALKYWGPTTHINFPLATYEKELEEMKNMSRQEFVANLRRKSSGFSRGASMYRGVTRHHQHGRWQARIGRVAGNKDLYLGTQEEAAEAYDIAAIKFRGTSAVTNFDISRYDVSRNATSTSPECRELAIGLPMTLGPQWSRIPVSLTSISTGP